MNLSNLKQIFADFGCNELYVKNLAANDNSKNQVYFGGNFDVINIFPFSDIVADDSAIGKRERFKAEVNFYWIDDQGKAVHAPHAKLILYPDYPEVRFSGFLKGSKNAPSYLMTNRIQDRLLFVAPDKKGNVLGFVVAPDTAIALEFRAIDRLEEQGVFKKLELNGNQNTKDLLLAELCRITNLGWINAKKLDVIGTPVPCNSSNCGGYTLEAELGVKPNGYAEPDFLGWEIKQFGVKRFTNINSRVITLMTPEPTHGFYKSKGTDYFIRTYGYPDRNGIEDRINFGGIHKVGQRHHLTNLKMELPGFDSNNGKIVNANGGIVLVDENGNDAASWSFSSMIKHWNKKHNKACYVPSINQQIAGGGKQYHYGNEVVLGIGADFNLFLAGMSRGEIYYDPGIKLENASTNPKIKKRSQFRIKSGFIKELYKVNETIKVCS